jgi:hypothetical protein
VIDGDDLARGQRVRLDDVAELDHMFHCVNLRRWLRWGH